MTAALERRPRAHPSDFAIPTPIYPKSHPVSSPAPGSTIRDVTPGPIDEVEPPAADVDLLGRRFMPFFGACLRCGPLCLFCPLPARAPAPPLVSSAAGACLHKGFCSTARRCKKCSLRSLRKWLGSSSAMPSTSRPRSLLTRLCCAMRKKRYAQTRAAARSPRQEPWNSVFDLSKSSGRRCISSHVLFIRFT
jgi:hypothetical protein